MTLLWTNFLAVMAVQPPVGDAPRPITQCAGPVLRSSTVPRNAADTALLIDIPDPGTLASGDALSLAFMREFDGPCATLAQRSSGGFVQLADGRVFGPTAKPGEHSLQEALDPFVADAYDGRTSSEKHLPSVDGEPLLLSVRVNSRKAGGDFVGVWRVGNEWLVRSFSQREDRSFTAPRAVLTSRLPVRGLTYLPSPDTPSGQLELVQQQSDGRARSIGFSWWHRLAFKQH